MELKGVCGETNSMCVKNSGDKEEVDIGQYFFAIHRG